MSSPEQLSLIAGTIRGYKSFAYNPKTGYLISPSQGSVWKNADNQWLQWKHGDNCPRYKVGHLDERCNCGLYAAFYYSQAFDYLRRENGVMTVVEAKGTTIAGDVAFRAEQLRIVAMTYIRGISLRQAVLGFCFGTLLSLIGVVLLTVFAVRSGHMSIMYVFIAIALWLFGPIGGLVGLGASKFTHDKREQMEIAELRQRFPHVDFCETPKELKAKYKDTISTINVS